MIIREGTYENKTLGYAFGKFFIRVFYHNFNIAKHFANKSEALSCDLPGKYSILNELDSSLYNINGKKYFIIRYPSISNSGIYFNQRNNPLYENKTLLGPTEDLNITYMTPYPNNEPFSGLATSNTSNVLLDGQPANATFYYSIGLYNRHHYYSLKGTPAGMNSFDYTDIVELWAQININYKINANTQCEQYSFILLIFLAFPLGVFVSL